jgi:hypothetical protein
MTACMPQLRKWILASLPLVLALGTADAAPRQHAVLLGPWRTASVLTEAGKTTPVKLRNLLIDEKFKEHTVGPSHEVSDRLFVVRKAAQVNDSLPQEANKSPRWIWRLEGWIGVDRQTGRVTQLNLPMFDHETSEVSWYRDLAAYCGTSEDHSKAYLIVFQLGKRKPLLKKEFAGAACSAPTWERQPTRVTFMNGQATSSFSVTSRGADPQSQTKDTEPNDDEDESE